MLNRLVQEHSTSDLINQHRNFTTNYVYDTVGNRLSKTYTGETSGAITYTYNNNDLLLTETCTGEENYSTTYGYNANGSLTSKDRTGDPGSNPEYAMYSYNLEQRLSTATIARIEDGHQVNLTSSYTYNQSGIRVRSDESYYVDENTNQTTEQSKVFLVDSYNPTGYAQVFEQRNALGDVQIAYTIGDDVLTQTIASAGTSGGQHLLYDGHGSTRLLTDATGLIPATARYDYDAYGIALNFDPTLTNQPLTNLLYSGEQFDPGLQQQYLRARYYDQATDRFNRLDPFKGSKYEPQSLHKYAYTHCDPVNGIDPSGKWLITIALGLIIALFLWFFEPALQIRNTVKQALTPPLNSFKTYVIETYPTDKKIRYLTHPLSTKWPTNVDELIDYLNDISETEEPGNVVISAHGYPGTVQLFYDTPGQFELNQFNFKNPTGKRKLLIESLEKCVADGGTLTFVSCHSGSGQLGDELLLSIDQYFKRKDKNIRVILFKTLCHWFWGNPIGDLNETCSDKYSSKNTGKK